ncbi:MAG TPA: hypothetical protein VMV20_04540, partial [Chitinophagaceae bacterium]|nr:hypothetical protein [Chitinophagaceae bacterium]
GFWKTIPGKMANCRLGIAAAGGAFAPESWQNGPEWGMSKEKIPYYFSITTTAEAIVLRWDKDTKTF